MDKMNLLLRMEKSSLSLDIAKIVLQRGEKRTREYKEMRVLNKVLPTGQKLNLGYTGDFETGSFYVSLFPNEKGLGFRSVETAPLISVPERIILIGKGMTPEPIDLRGRVIQTPSIDHAMSCASLIVEAVHTYRFVLENTVYPALLQ